MGLVDLLLPQRCVGCGTPSGILCGRCLALLPRLAAPLCARCGAPTAYPVDRCRDCAGRRLAFASARAAVGLRGRASRRLVIAWKERGLRRAAGLAAELVADAVPRPDVAVALLRAAGRRSQPEARPPSARAARAGARRAAGSCPSSRCSRAAGRSRASAASGSPTGGATSRAPSAPARCRLPRSRSSTTSTRPARRRRPPRRRCARPGRAASRS